MPCWLGHYCSPGSPTTEHPAPDTAVPPSGAPQRSPARHSTHLVQSERVLAAPRRRRLRRRPCRPELPLPLRQQCRRVGRRLLCCFQLLLRHRQLLAQRLSLAGSGAGGAGGLRCRQLLPQQGQLLLPVLDSRLQGFGIGLGQGERGSEG